MQKTPSNHGSETRGGHPGLYNSRSIITSTDKGNARNGGLFAAGARAVWRLRRSLHSLDGLGATLLLGRTAPIRPREPVDVALRDIKL